MKQSIHPLSGVRAFLAPFWQGLWHEWISQRLALFLSGLFCTFSSRGGKQNDNKKQVVYILLQKIEGEPLTARCEGVDVWEQATRHLQAWSTPSSRNQKVNITIAYDDATDYQGRLELPWFEGTTRHDPLPHLGRHLLAFLEDLPQFPWLSPESCEQARQAVLHRLSCYEIGEATFQEEVRACIERVQQLDFSAFLQLSPRYSDETTDDEHLPEMEA